MKNKITYLIIIALFSLSGCFSIKKYNGASINDSEEYLIRYAFRDVESPPYDGIDFFWRNVDSLLPNSYIKKFFRIKRNGEIEPRDPRAKNKKVYIYYVNFPYCMRSEVGTLIRYTSESDYRNGLEWRQTYFDHNGNIREIHQFGPYKHILYFHKGTGYYIYVDSHITIDTVNISKPNNGYKSYNKYDKKGLLDRQCIEELNDTLLRVERERGYIKYEGNIQNNYKVGEWRYYNHKNEVERIEHYKLKDLEDVRFPYCYLRKRKTKPIERDFMEIEIVNPGDSILNTIELF